MQTTGDKIPFNRLINPRSCAPLGCARRGGGVLGEGEMLKSSESQTIYVGQSFKCFRLIETSPSPSGVSLVRFFPLVERNEHNKQTDKLQFINRLQ